MNQKSFLARTAAQVQCAFGALNTLPLWPLQTIARIAVGSVFYRAAILKIRSPEITLVLFRDEYQVPYLSYDVAAQLAIMAEMGGALLLFAGLFTRLATLPLFGTIAVIQIFVYPAAWVEHLTWSTALLLILMRGPGPLSLDYLFTRFMRAHPAPMAQS